DTAARRTKHPEQEAQQRALARAVAAEQHRDLPRREPEVEPLQHIPPPTVGEVEPFDRDDVVHRFPSVAIPSSASTSSRRRVIASAPCPARSAAAIASRNAASVCARRSALATAGPAAVTKTPDPLRPSVAPRCSR